MTRTTDLALTAIAPIIWGSTYYVVTEFLPADYPLTTSLLRALPAGLILLLWVRQLPTGIWWARMTLLGFLNISLFFFLLFYAAYHLPGGVAATVIAIQPLLVILIARLIVKSPITTIGIAAAIAGLCGVALLILTPEAALDPLGILAGFAAAASMGTGTVLTHHWRPNVPPLTSTAWQLTAGGIILIPIVLLLEPPLPPLTQTHITGFIYLCIIGTIPSYALWFRGISRITPAQITPLVFISPLTAVIVGWALLNQSLNIPQILGIIIVLASIIASQYKPKGG